MRAAILIAALLTACEGKNEAASNATVEPPQASPPTATTAAPPKPDTPPAKPFAIEEKNDLYILSFGWSAEAAATPKLVTRFTKELEDTKAKLIADAKEDRDERAKGGFDYHPHEIQRSYETAGQSGRLLSLESSVWAYSGGAHGSGGSGSLVWDRQLEREVSIQDLLRPGTSWTGAIRQPFCVLLDREREERRGVPVKRDDMFGNCPKSEEVTSLLSDEDKNGRFDHIRVIADQYVAGPYAEGPYEVSLPITATMIERLKPEYRDSFEPRPGVK